MKKFLYTATLALASLVAVNAQDKGEEFDKKWRFGLRVAAQPTWLTSNDNNNKPSGTKFGTGFGMNIEYRFSKIVALSTGIGADFEGGKYAFKYDTAQSSYYVPGYYMNSGGEFIEPKNDMKWGDLVNSNTAYVLERRELKTTHVTIPALMKLSTNEYNGMKYFGMFGGEIGIRIKSVAHDYYRNTYTFNSTGVMTASTTASDQENINIASDASLIPLRAGFNAGFGMEYRLGGSTSAFFSLNYFRSFTNLMGKTSEVMVYNVDGANPNALKFSYVKQNYILNAIRINLGILF